MFHRHGGFLTKWGPSVGATLVFVCGLNAQSADPQAGLINRDASAVSQKTGKLYILDTAHDSIIVVQQSGEVHHVNVGSRPDAIAINNLTGMAYVVSPASRNVSVIDTSKDEVVATIPTGARSYAIAVDESANKVYIGNTFSTMLTVIDGETNTASNLKVHSADAVMVDTERKRIYLFGYESDTFTELNPADGSTSRIFAGAMHQWGTARAGKTVYVAHVQDSNIAAIDLESHAVRTIPTGAMPCAIAINPIADEIYVANYADGTVTILKKEVAAATLKVARHPQGIGIDATHGLLYVASPQENLVTLIDLKSRRVLRNIKAAEHPYAIAIDPISNFAYAVNQGNVPYTKLRP